MAKTEKARKGPSDSATEHSIGTQMKGNDGICGPSLQQKMEYIDGLN